jgi:hypothetical protein
MTTDAEKMRKLMEGVSHPEKLKILQSEPLSLIKEMESFKKTVSEDVESVKISYDQEMVVLETYLNKALATKTKILGLIDELSRNGEATPDDLEFMRFQMESTIKNKINELIK